MKQIGKQLALCILAGAIAIEGLLPCAAAVDTTKRDNAPVSVEVSEPSVEIQSAGQAEVLTALLSGETVVPVADDTVTEEQLRQEGEALGLTVSGAYDKEGSLTAAVVEESPAIAAAIDELNSGELSTLSSEEDASTDGQVAGLSTAEKEKLLSAYAAYQQYQAEHADYFGVQTPFFTTKDVDSNPIGSLLSVVGTKQDENGYYTEQNGEKTYLTVDDVCATIQLFALADQYAVELMGDTLLEKKQEALAQLDDSMNEQEKLLVLADWLTEQTSFDMGYLMNLPAKESKQSPYYDAVHSGLEQQYGAEVADQMTDAVINVWRSTQFGALCEGKCVCLAYARAYAYLVQWANPALYQNSDGSWKSYLELNYREKISIVRDEDGNVLWNDDGTIKTKTTYVYDPDAGAVVDLVRITLNADSSMYGQTVTSAYSDHYWNAVKLGDAWYYVDPCYMDVETECMNRDRVETDGQLSHTFFLFSDTSMRAMYKGSYTAMDTLYEDNAVDTQYEHAWYSYAKGPVSYQNGAWYYFYDSTDSMSEVTGGSSTVSPTYQIMQRVGETQTPLITFDTESDGGCTVYDASTGEMQNSEELTQAYEKHVAYQKRYPAVRTCVGVYQNVVYFNVANAIYSYNLQTSAVRKVKEYNQVWAQRDWSEAFGGRAFTVTKDESKADLHVENHPLSGLLIRDDGTMTVSVATNYALISSPGRRNMDDILSDGQYGYEFEETNYNSSLEHWGIWVAAKGKNDNSEFMWSANFVETLSMKKLTGKHHYQTVEVPATCEENAFTERRCTDCGAIAPNSREEQDGTALGHHYIASEEKYYTKTSGHWNRGTAYVCTICQDAQTTLPEGQSGQHSYGAGSFTWNEKHTECVMQHSCTVCSGRPLDCVRADKTVDETVDCDISVSVKGRCDTGLLYSYTATAPNGEQDVQTEQRAPQEHEMAEVEARVEPTCTQSGWTERIICRRCGAVVREREEIPALGHEYEDTVLRAATPVRNGVMQRKCTRCGNIKAESIERPSTAKTNLDAYVYNGADRSPKVVVKDSKGNVIANTHYTLSYTNGRRTVGRHTVVITFDGRYYSGEMTAEYVIQPTAVKGWKVSAQKKALATSWTANAAQTTGYQIQYARSSTFPAGSRKNAWISQRKTTSKRVTAGVLSRKTYYVRIRAYRTVNGQKIYSNWSSVKKIVSK